MGEEADAVAQAGQGLRVRWRPLAEADLDTIVDYVARDNLKAAIELGDKIERRVTELGDQPRLYRAGRVKNTREMVVDANYVVIYRIKRGEIEIIRILHAAQQWPRSR